MVVVRPLQRYFRDVIQLPRDVRLFLAYALFSNVAIGSFALLYNLYLLQLGYREDFIGLVNAAATGSLAISALGLGRLLQRRGAWWCLTYGTVGYLLASGALALVIVVAIAQGMATTFLFVPLMPFVLDHTPTERRATVAALSLSLTSVSATLGSLLGGWAPGALGSFFHLAVPSVASYRSALVASIVVCSLSLVPLVAMREARRARPEDALGEGTSLEATIPPSRVRRWVIAFALTGGILSLGNGAIVPFYNVFLDSLGLSARTIGVVFAAANLIGALFGLLGPAVARALGPLRAVILIRFLPIPLFVLIALLPLVPLAILTHIVRMISISMAWPIDSLLVAELLPSAARAQAFSLRSATWNIGFSSASLLGGYLIAAYGYAPVMVAYVLFCTLAILYFGYEFGYRRPVDEFSGDRIPVRRLR